MRVLKTLLLGVLTLSVYGQVIEKRLQINYGTLPDEVKNALLEELEEMDLENIRFNFYQIENTDMYPVEFLRKGVSLKALGGLETIIFHASGKVLERRFKYFSEDVLANAPLESIIELQNQTSHLDLKYLIKYETADKLRAYKAIGSDSTYYFNEFLEFVNSEKSVEIIYDIKGQSVLKEN